jgi:hypothetical protein
MSDPTNKAGITKNSTLIVDIPDYPPTSSQKQLNLVANTTTAQTIYPPNGEYWNSIKYSVNVPNPVYPTVTFNTITNNNTTYTLSQLTSNQSQYFNKNSTINVSTLQIYFKTKFKYSRGDDVLKTPTWYYVSSDRTITLAAKEAVYVFRNGNGQLTLHEHISDDENTYGTANLKTGDYYFRISTNQTTNNVILKLWYDGNLFKETKFSESDTANPDYFFNTIIYLNSQFSSS